MNNKVVSILERQPHMKGAAVCLGCKHEWESLATPLGTVVLDCPECGLMKGVFKGVCLPEGVIWHCGCGCVHFFITSGCTCCCHCGAKQEFDGD